MIDERKTFEKFGYYSADLTLKSSKKVICICEICKKERLTGKKDCSKLCKSCSNIGKNNPMYGKIGKNNPNFGICHSEETKQKMSKNHKDVSGKNNPLYGVRKFGKDNPNWKGGKAATERRHNSKRKKLLDLNPIELNKDFKECNGHHINSKYIINIPAELHRSIFHRQTDGRGMKEINKLAFEYLLNNKENMIISMKSVYYINLMVL